jgi:hypothetical protein
LAVLASIPTVTTSLETGVILFAAGVGGILTGLITRGLIVLAVDTANDIHAGVQTRLLAAMANAATSGDTLGR